MFVKDFYLILVIEKNIYASINQLNHKTRTVALRHVYLV